MTHPGAVSRIAEIFCPEKCVRRCLHVAAAPLIRSRRTAHSAALTRLAQVSALALAATLVGCQSTRQVEETDSVRAHNYQARLKHRPAPLVIKPVEQKAPDDVWERMRQGFVLQDSIDVNPRIEQQRLWFASNPSFLETAGERGSLYLH